MKTLKEFIIESTATGDKINRDAFIYLNPKAPTKDFAQCKTCTMFLPNKQRCSAFSESFKVVANGSCALYCNGKPNDNQQINNSVTPEQAGYVVAQVRCENCDWFKDDICKLYEILNNKLPDIFELDENVDLKGCCNAWQK